MPGGRLGHVQCWGVTAWLRWSGACGGAEAEDWLVGEEMEGEGAIKPELRLSEYTLSLSASAVTYDG